MNEKKENENRIIVLAYINGTGKDAWTGGKNIQSIGSKIFRSSGP